MAAAAGSGVVGRPKTVVLCGSSGDGICQNSKRLVLRCVNATGERSLLGAWRSALMQSITGLPSQEACDVIQLQCASPRFPCTFSFFIL